MLTKKAQDVPRAGTGARTLRKPETAKRIREVQLIEAKKQKPPTVGPKPSKPGDKVPSVVYGAIEKPKRKQVPQKSIEEKIQEKRNKYQLQDETQSEDEQTTYYQLVRKNRPFRLYLISYIANHIGEWLTYLASISAIEDIQKANGIVVTSRTAISALIIIRLMPNVILSPFGGVLADGLDRRRSMIALDLLGAVCALVFIYAVSRKSIALIYTATVLQECVAGLYEPSRKAIIPLLVPEEEEQKKATTLAELAWSVMAALGCAVGGFLVSLWGIRCCYFIDSITYLVSAYLMNLVGGKWTVISQETKVEDPIEYAKGMVIDGFKYLRKSFFGMLVFLKFTAALVYGAMDVLNVSFSERGDSDGRSFRLGLLFGAVGFGCLVGPLIADNFTDMSCPKTLQVTCIYAIFLIGGGSMLMGLSEYYWTVLLLSVVRSMGNSCIWIYSTLLFQKFSDPEMFGRVAAMDYSLALLAECISALIAGLLQDHLHMKAEEVAVCLGSVGLFFGVLWSVYHWMGYGAAKFSKEDATTATESTADTPQPSEYSNLLPSDEDLA